MDDDVTGDEHLRVEHADGVLRLTMDRPAAMNALTWPMMRTMIEAIERAGSDEETRVVVLAGSGGHFSAGADIGGEGVHERFDVRAMDVTNRLIRAITGCAKPVVASVHGVAAGVACGIALAADLQVVHTDASFLLAFARIGFMPDGGTSASVAASVGRARAMRMAMLAEPLGAPEAYERGLVSHLTTSDHHEVLGKVVHRLRTGPPLAYTATKRAINDASVPTLDAALETERTGQTVLMRTADVAEGMAAFNEGRKPVFRGE